MDAMNFLPGICFVLKDIGKMCHCLCDIFQRFELSVLCACMFCASDMLFASRKRQSLQQFVGEVEPVSPDDNTHTRGS